ncbi:universal stress protein [Streptomyces sp. NPDC005125]
MDRYGVLVGYTGSASSRRALSYAAGVARRSGAALLIVYVTTQNSLASLLGYDAIRANGDDHALLRQLASEDHLSGLPWMLIHRRGAVADELESVGRRYRANAIIVGRTRKAGTGFLRSISGRLTRDARRPVIVVP